MVVEDDKFLSSLLKARLEKDGFGTVQAFDGEEAINLLRQAKPDLILLDLIMPKVSGFEVLHTISLSPQLNKIPVVVLSNLGQDDDIQKARSLGAAEYFVKVRVSIDNLVGKINTMLQ